MSSSRIAGHLHRLCGPTVFRLVPPPQRASEGAGRTGMAEQSYCNTNGIQVQHHLRQKLEGRVRAVWSEMQWYQETPWRVIGLGDIGEGNEHIRTSLQILTTTWIGQLLLRYSRQETCGRSSQHDTRPTLHPPPSHLEVVEALRIADGQTPSRPHPLAQPERAQGGNQDLHLFGSCQTTESNLKCKRELHRRGRAEQGGPRAKKKEESTRDCQ